MSQAIEFLGGRKLFLSLFVLIASTVFLFLGRITEVNYYDLVKIIIAMYVGANVVQVGVFKQSSKIQMIEQALAMIPESTDPTTAGRKFWLVVGLFVLTIPLLILKTITPDVYTDIANWICGVYLTGNVAEKAAANLIIAPAKPSIPSTATPDLSKVVIAEEQK